MKYLDEFRDPAAAARLVESIRRRASRRWTIMEVCGGQTHSLLRHGIDMALAGVVELVHGPGCPVCVTPVEAIDEAVHLAARSDVILTTFGDMLRVPGSQSSLERIRATTGRVRPVYSPMDAVNLAEQQPDRQVVFFAVGFETTAPATALAVQQAARRGVRNFSLLVAHVRVQPAMETLMRQPETRVDGFLAAGHVCTVTGYESYEAFCREFCVPVVVAGFEPLDLLVAIDRCVEQLEQGRHQVENCYSRSVRAPGNRQAQYWVDEVFEPCDRPWRGLGLMPLGGLQLRPSWSHFDARRRFDTQLPPVLEISDCRAGDVLAGRIKPTECPRFATDCTPDQPLGAPMVSSEGACAAYYRYQFPLTAVDG